MYHSGSKYDTRSRRASSVQLEPIEDHPGYINAPKVYMKKVSKQTEFKDAYGNLLKNILIDEYSSIERDYTNTERVSDNVVKQRNFQEERLYQMDMKTKQQLWKIEQNRMAAMEKKQKIKKRKNALKRKEFVERKEEMMDQQRQERLKKLEASKIQMEKFEDKRKEKMALLNNFQYDYSQYNKMLEVREQQAKDEEDRINYILQNYNDRQNRVQKAHQQIIKEQRNRLKFDHTMKDRANSIATERYEQRQHHSLQQLANRYEKIDQATLLKQKEAEKQLRKQKRKEKLKQELHEENLEKVTEEKKIRQLSYRERKEMFGNTEEYKQKQLQWQSSSPIKTLAEMTVEKRELNQQRLDQVKKNKEMIKKQQEFDNDQKMQKQLMITKQRNLVKDVRQKIRDYRMVARFQQREKSKDPNNDLNQTIL